MDDAAFRRAHVGAAEASALLGLHPRLSYWQLWHRKKGDLPEDDFADNERAQWGVRLEPYIIKEAAARMGWDVRPWRRKPLSNGALGGHPDALRRIDGKAMGIIEAKNVDRLVFADWWDDERRAYVPPDHYLIQPQVYCGLARFGWTALCVLVGGNDLHIFEYAARPKLFAALDAKARAFWQSIRDGVEPKPDFGVDADAIAKVYRTGGGGAIDLTGDNLMADACARYLEGHAIESEGKAMKAAAAAEIRAKCGTADHITCGEFVVTFSTSADVPDRLITAGDIGTTIKGRKGSRSIGVRSTTPRQQKEAA